MKINEIPILDSQFIILVSEINMTTSSMEDLKVKIGCFIDAALKEEIPWTIFENFLDKMASSLDKSKQVIKILLRIIQEKHKPITQKNIKDETIENQKVSKEDEVIEIETEDKSDEITLKDSNGMKCDLCDKTFITNKALDKHIKRHEKQSNVPETSKSKDSSTVEDVIIEEPTSTRKDTVDVVLENDTPLEVVEDQIESEVVNHETNGEDNEVPVDNTANLNTNSSIRVVEDTSGFVENNSNSEVIETTIKSEAGTSSDHIDIKGDCSITLVDVSAILNRSDEKHAPSPECKNSDQENESTSNNLQQPKILIDGQVKQDTDVITNTNERRYHCKICPKTLKSKSTLYNHKKTHSSERPYNCKTCPKSFKTSIVLYTHQKMHSTDKPFQCAKCEKKFSMKQGLKRHELIHADVKSFKCQVCSKAFKDPLNLKNHRRIHTGEKPFQCKTCGKRFTQACTLSTHNNIHTEERSYTCKTCGKSFNRSGNLKVHEETHSNERPYHCKFCESSFKQYTALLGHTKTHSGEKPYKCQTCSKSFLFITYLKKHEKIHRIK